jgi:hypothetical protein
MYAYVHSCASVGSYCSLAKLSAFLGGACIARVMIVSALAYVRCLMYTALAASLPAPALSKPIAYLFIGASTPLASLRGESAKHERRGNPLYGIVYKDGLSNFTVILEGTPHRTCHIEDPQTALLQTKTKHCLFIVLDCFGTSFLAMTLAERCRYKGRVRVC